MRNFFLSAAATALMAVSGAAAQADVTIETARGPATVPEAPKTVAVFDIAALDTLNALGVAIAGVPSKLYVTYLEQVGADAKSAGTIHEPNLELLAALAPDLIVVGTRSSPHLETVAKVAPAIDMTIYGAGIVEQARARIAAFGTIFAKADEAKALIAKLDAKLAEAKAVTKDKGKALILLTNGNKISAFGSGSRFGWLHDDLGLAQAAEDLKAAPHGHAVSFEFVAETNPDWLLIVDRGAAIGQGGAAQATLDNPLVAQTTAAKNGQVVYLDAAPLYVAGGGAQSMMITLDQIIAAFGGKEG